MDQAARLAAVVHDRKETLLWCIEKQVECGGKVEVPEDRRQLGQLAADQRLVGLALAAALGAPGHDLRIVVAQFRDFAGWASNEKP